MPLYEFVCSSCDEEFEKICRSTSESPVVCPSCGTEKVDKKISSFAFSRGSRGKSSSSEHSGSSSKSGCGTCASRRCSSCH